MMKHLLASDLLQKMPSIHCTTVSSFIMVLVFAELLITATGLPIGKGENGKELLSPTMEYTRPLLTEAATTTKDSYCDLKMGT